MTLAPAELLHVRRLPLLRSVASATFARLMDGAAVQRVRRGVELIAEGENQDLLYVLLDGLVELEGAWNERDATLALLHPLSTLALSSVMLRTPVLTTARTIGRCKVLTIPGEAFREAAREDPALAAAVIEELSGCYNSVVRALKNCKLRGAQERLANYLLALQQRQGGAAAFQLPCHKRVLASLLSMTPENLSRALASLADYGVKVDGPLITVAQPEALMALAKPNALIDGHAGRVDGELGQAERERRRCGLNAHA